MSLRPDPTFYATAKLAMEAPVKMLGPLIISIFPMVFIVIFGPMAIRLLTERGIL